MKKFSKILVASLALALAFGMTVSAASPTTENTTVEEKALKSAAQSVSESISAPEGVAVSVTAATPEQLNNVIGKAIDSSVQANVASALGLPGAKITDVMVVFNIEANATNVPMTFRVERASTSRTYALLHMNDDGSVKEVLPAKCSADGWITATFSTYSVYAVVEVTSDAAPQGATSPKTGETLPVIGFMALILLAGVVVCAKKVRFNR